MRHLQINLFAAVVYVLVFGFASLAGPPLDSKYISVDEISAGDSAYCLTVYKGVGIEKFELKVVDVVKNIRPGRDAILVMGTDDRFIHTGPVAGCSGSPVYVNGRLAGALAFGWTFVKDPLYGVTPIAEMLSADDSAQPGNPVSVNIDYSEPVDLRRAYEQMMAAGASAGSARTMTAMNYMYCPLAVSLPQESLSEFEPQLESFGLVPVSSGGASGNMAEYMDVPLSCGSVLAVPLAYGDIELSAIGTVTEVVGDKVYGFGHSFLNQGPIDVPMATGYVHTVVANVARSFKFGRSIDVKGALYTDASAAIVGRIGKEPQVIDAAIRVDHFADSRIRDYNFKVATHRYLTPLIAAICVSGSAQMRASLPEDHSVYYSSKIGIEGYEPVEFSNFSTGSGLGDCIYDNIGAITLIMNNPYKQCRINSLDFEIKIVPKTKASQIWSFDISEATIEPGETVEAEIVLETYLEGRKRYKTEITIPEDTAPGSYELLLLGPREYAGFKISAEQYRYIPENLGDLIGIINEIANIKRNRLHLVMALPPSGIAIEGAALPNLPGSKAVLLTDEKRSVITQPTVGWIEKTIESETMVTDSRSLRITVEQKR